MTGAHPKPIRAPRRPSELRRTKPLNKRSKKKQAEYVERRKLVARLLKERPKCERCKWRRSCDVHEVLTRARGGSILDEASCRALCRRCHDHVHANPVESLAEGWLKSGVGR